MIFQINYKIYCIKCVEQAFIMSNQMKIIFKTFLFTSLAYLSASQQQSKTDKQQIPGVGLSVVFVFGGLLMGGLLKIFSRVTHVPYNPLLIFVGLGLGFYHQNLKFLGKAALLISQLNPNGVIAIFLPALIFQSAFKTQWHMFKKQSGQTLILGIPCAVLGAILIAIGFKLFLEQLGALYSWTEAFLVGSILSCTDIFSFVLRLRKHGTPQKIISLIQGQSLINYCTCVLVFQLINQIVVDYDRSSLLYLGQLFVEETLGGVLFGLGFGLVALLCLKRIIYDGVLVVTIMVIFCYSIYLIAEFSVLRVSGIVSIVVYALYMNVFGKTIVTGQVSSYVNTFWSYIVFVAETSIFLIAGVNIGVKVLTFEDLVSLDELSTAFYVYLICLAARFISIACCIKWLHNLGYGMNIKEAFIIAYTGLKGAIGISLAMLVYENNDYNEKMRHLTLFIVAANSIISLTVNGGSAGFLVKMLGLSTLTKVQYKFYKEFLYTFQKNLLHKKAQLKGQKFLQMVNWEEIDVLVGLPRYKKLRDQTDKFIAKAASKNDSKFQKRQMYKLEQALKSYAHKNNPVSNMAEKEVSNENARFDLVVQLRKRFIKASIAKYWEYHDESYISPGALLLLLQSAYFDLDTQTEELQSWAWIRSQISYNIKFLSQLMKISVLNQVAKSYLFQYISYCYDIVSSYVEASEAVRTEFRSFSLVSHQKDILEIIMTESEQNQKQAQSFLRNYLQPSFPEIQREVVTRKASYHVISYFNNIIDRFYQTGQLEINEYQMLKNITEQRSLQLDLSSPKWQVTDFLQTLKNDQVFSILPDAVLTVLSKDLTQQTTFDVNQKVLQYAELAKYVYFVKKGGCQVEFINENAIYKQSLLQGQMIGFEALVSNTYHSTVTANTMVSVMAIKKTCIQKIMDTFPKFQQAFWKRHIFQLYKMFLSRGDLTFHLSHLKKPVIDELLEHFALQEYQPGRYAVAKDMIFLRGEIEVIESEGAEESHPLIFFSKSDECQLEVKRKSIFLVGDIDYQAIQKSNRFYSNYVVGMSRIKKKDTIQQKQQVPMSKDLLFGDSPRFK